MRRRQAADTSFALWQTAAAPISPAWGALDQFWTNNRVFGALISIERAIARQGAWELFVNFK
jgi:hypothetical protein